MHDNVIFNDVWDKVLRAWRVAMLETLPASGGDTGTQTSITTTPVQFVSSNTGRRSGVIVRNTGSEDLYLGFDNTDLHWLLKQDECVVIPTSEALWVKNGSGSSGSLCYLET